jgi:hypothetical protein
VEVKERKKKHFANRTMKTPLPVATIEHEYTAGTSSPLHNNTEPFATRQKNEIQEQDETGRIARRNSLTGQQGLVTN